MSGVLKRSPRGRPGDPIERSSRCEDASAASLPSVAQRTVAWHDLECGAYRADLELWQRIAARAEGAILDLGCGSGRVARQLGQSRHSVVGLDRDPILLGALRRRSGGLAIETVSADARSFELKRRFGLAIAPMQLVQLLSDAGERLDFLQRLDAHLTAGGRAALAIVERVAPGVGNLALNPDLARIGGCLYSSTPFEAEVSVETIVIRRWRQLLCDNGEAMDELDEVALRQLTAAQLEGEAAAVGLSALDRVEVPASEDHVGSTVVLLGREG